MAEASPKFGDMTQRLRAAGRATRDAQETYDAERRRRDELVVEASDTGMPQRAIAAAVGLQRSRIVSIIAEQSAVG